MTTSFHRWSLELFRAIHFRRRRRHLAWERQQLQRQPRLGRCVGCGVAHHRRRLGGRNLDSDGPPTFLGGNPAEISRTGSDISDFLSRGNLLHQSELSLEFSSPDPQLPFETPSIEASKIRIIILVLFFFDLGPVEKKCAGVRTPEDQSPGPTSYNLS